MLLGAVTVLVVVATTEPGAATAPKDPTTRAMEKALRTALGADAVVTVRRSSGESDEQLIGWANGEHANLLGVVTWSEEQRRATLRFVHPGDGRWGDREIRFDTKDAPAERGRTVGFAFASMVPDDAIPPRPSEVPPAPPPTERPSPETPPETPAPAPAPLRPPGRWTLDAAGTVASGVGGFGGGIGGMIAVRYAFAPPLALRVGLGAREGDIAPASATSRVYVGAAGLAWHPTFGGRFGAGARLDALLLAHELVHLSADDQAPAHLVRVLPGAGATLEGSWRFAEQASLFAGFGAEVAFGRTDVFVRDRLVAELSPFRVFGEAGVRVSF